MNQPAFIDHLLTQTDLSGPNVNTVQTPHRPGYPVDTIPNETYDKHLTFKYTKLMQFLIGSINWLAISTRPDIATISKILSQYMAHPSKGYIDAAKRVL